MKKSEIIKALGHVPAGGFFSITVLRPAHLNASHKEVDLQVESVFQMQKAAYSKRKAVREAVANGEREAPTLPKWLDPQSLESVKGIHFASHWNGTEYLRQPQFEGNKTSKKFLLNGKEISPEDVRGMVQVSKEFRSRPSTETLASKGQVRFNTVKLENVNSVR